MRVVHFRSEESGDAWGRISSDGASIERVDGHPFDGGAPFEDRRTREVVSGAAAVLLPPALPTKIIGIGRNFGAHARELGNEPPAEPLVFLKAPSALCPHGGTVRLPAESHRVDYEGELAIVIGARVRRLPRARYREAILGWSVACDVTARDLQKRDVQFARAKSFDTFCPLGPWIETNFFPEGRHLETRINGETRQRGSFDDLIFSAGVIIEYVSAFATLEPGDVILTGTPEGVGALTPGDLVEVEIEGIGRLSFGVSAE